MSATETIDEVMKENNRLIWHIHDAVRTARRAFYQLPLSNIFIMPGLAIKYMMALRLLPASAT